MYNEIILIIKFGFVTSVIIKLLVSVITKTTSNNIIYLLSVSTFTLAGMKFISRNNVRYTGRTYVKFLSLASFGIIGLGAPSFSQWVGLDR